MRIYTIEQYKELLIYEVLKDPIYKHLSETYGLKFQEKGVYSEYLFKIYYEFSIVLQKVFQNENKYMVSIRHGKSFERPFTSLFMFDLNSIYTYIELIKTTSISLGVLDYDLIFVRLEKNEVVITSQGKEFFRFNVNDNTLKSVQILKGFYHHLN